MDTIKNKRGGNMKLDLSSLPIEFVNGLEKICLCKNFKIKDELVTEDTEGMMICSVIMYKNEDNTYTVCYGGSCMDRNGEFKLYPLDDEDYPEFIEKVKFNSIEEAWNLFYSKYIY